jgi:signal transduction histidine kinase
VTTFAAETPHRTAAAGYLMVAGLGGSALVVLATAASVVWAVLIAGPALVVTAVNTRRPGRATTLRGSLWWWPARLAGRMLGAWERRTVLSVLDLGTATLPAQIDRDRAVLATLVLAAPSLLAAGLALVIALAAALTVSLPLWAGPHEKFALGELGSVGVGNTTRQWIGAGVGIALISILVLVLPRLGALRARLMLRMLGQLSRAQTIAALQEQMDSLRESRTAAVRVNLSDHQRLERDLHDGVQARLTSLVMSLGRAQRKLHSDLDTAAQLIADARRDANQVLDEIRNIARGIQPPVLADRGLEAAITSLTSTFPTEIRIRIDLPERLPRDIETTAYFIVAESLTNVMKHASARRAWVTVFRTGSRCTVEIGDDGVGGARAGRSGGLAGLADRALSVGGTMALNSPAGGPTRIQVELPCG